MRPCVTAVVNCPALWFERWRLLHVQAGRTDSSCRSRSSNPAKHDWQCSASTGPAPLTSRLVEWLRGALDPIVSPQLASVATMLLVSIFVLTNTVSTDGSVGGIYHATVQLAQRTADSASKSSAFPNGMKKLEGSVNDLMGG